MKISELFEADVVSDPSFGVFSNRTPKKIRPKYDKKPVDNNYTPGKAMLDKEYEETEKFTNTFIPYKQSELSDPRN
jgi:hypothetical protein